MTRPVVSSPGSEDTLSRRRFLAGTTAGAAFMIVPRHVLGGRGFTPPSEKLAIAGIGIGGMGRVNLEHCESENLVALCDVDASYGGKTFEKYPGAKRYEDFRVMLEKEPGIDAVIVATPDHSHAVIALEAIRRGKHVYVQKPLAHSIHEVRALRQAAREHGVATQMGNQGRSGDGVRTICEWIWSGAIGPVREVHAWTNRPVWPQGIEVERPAERPPVPAGLNWDLWLGPAPERPYHPEYHPDKWRAWWDFGTGSLGDLGCHILDPVCWALRLGDASSVEACVSAYWHRFWQKTEPRNETYPRSTIVRYHFPQREGMPALDLTWWDGGMLPPRPRALEEGRQMGDDDGGVLFLGEHGVLMCGCYGRNPSLVPAARMAQVGHPPESLERIPGGEGGHEQDWIRACKGEGPACSNFDVSGPLSEMALLGNLAIRYPGRRLLWDGPGMKVTNDPDADAYVRRHYREGWSP